MSTDREMDWIFKVHLSKIQIHNLDGLLVLDASSSSTDNVGAGGHHDHHFALRFSFDGRVQHLPLDVRRMVPHNGEMISLHTTSAVSAFLYRIGASSPSSLADTLKERMAVCDIVNTATQEVVSSQVISLWDIFDRKNNSTNSHSHRFIIEANEHRSGDGHNTVQQFSITMDEIRSVNMQFSRLVFQRPGLAHEATTFYVKYFLGNEDQINASTASANPSQQTVQCSSRVGCTDEDEVILKGLRHLPPIIHKSTQKGLLKQKLTMVLFKVRENGESSECCYCRIPLSEALHHTSITSEAVTYPFTITATAQRSESEFCTKREIAREILLEGVLELSNLPCLEGQLHLSDSGAGNADTSDGKNEVMCAVAEPASFFGTLLQGSLCHDDLVPAPPPPLPPQQHVKDYCIPSRDDSIHDEVVKMMAADSYTESCTSYNERSVVSSRKRSMQSREDAPTRSAPRPVAEPGTYPSLEGSHCGAPLRGALSAEPEPSSPLNFSRSSQVNAEPQLVSIAECAIPHWSHSQLDDIPVARELTLPAVDERSIPSMDPERFEGEDNYIPDIVVDDWAMPGAADVVEVADSPTPPPKAWSPTSKEVDSLYGELHTLLESYKASNKECERLLSAPAAVATSVTELLAIELNLRGKLTDTEERLRQTEGALASHQANSEARLPTIKALTEREQLLSQREKELMISLEEAEQTLLVHSQRPTDLSHGAIINERGVVVMGEARTTVIIDAPTPVQPSTPKSTTPSPRMQQLSSSLGASPMSSDEPLPKSASPQQPLLLRPSEANVRSRSSYTPHSPSVIRRSSSCFVSESGNSVCAPHLSPSKPGGSVRGSGMLRHARHQTASSPLDCGVSRSLNRRPASASTSPSSSCRRPSMGDTARAVEEPRCCSLDRSAPRQSPAAGGNNWWGIKRLPSPPSHQPDSCLQLRPGTTEGMDRNLLLTIEVEALLEAIQRNERNVILHLLKTKPKLVFSNDSVLLSCCAVDAPDVDVIEALLRIRPELIYCVDRATGNTAMHVLCGARRPSLSCIRKLLTMEQAPPIEVRNKSGLTAFHVALMNEADSLQHRVKDTLLSLSNHVSVNERTSQGDTPLHLVCGSDKNVPLVRYLLARGADLWSRAPCQSDSMVTRDVTPLERSRAMRADGVARLIQEAVMGGRALTYTRYAH